jgi:hypothetical protein
MSRDPGPPEPWRGRSCKIRRDPSEDGSKPALLPRQSAIRRPSYRRTTRPHSTPETAWISTGCREIQALPGHGEGVSCKIRRDPSEDGSKPALLPRRCALRRATHGRTTRPTRPPKPLGSRPDVARSRPSRAMAREILQNKARSERRRVETRPSPTTERYTQAVIPPHNPTPLDPRNRLDLDRMSRDPGPPEPRRGGSCKITQDPSEDGSKPAPLPRRCALRRPSYRRTTRPTRPPKPLGSRPVFARSRPSRATAREILQNKARSERRRVETRPPSTSVSPTQGDALLHNPTHSAPETAWISTGCREIQALPGHDEGDPAKQGEIRAKTGRNTPPFHVGAPYTQGDARPHNPTHSAPETARISTRLREIQALPGHGEGDPAK